MEGADESIEQEIFVPKYKMLINFVFRVRYLAEWHMVRIMIFSTSWNRAEPFQTGFKQVSEPVYKDCF